jgi:outer membrane immunogenic protein
MRIKNLALFAVAIVLTGIWSIKLALAGPEPIVEINPAPPPPYDWSGLYIGKNIGGTSGDFHFDGFHEDVDAGTQFHRTRDFMIFGGTPLTTGFDIPSRSKRDGSIIGGSQIGYNFQFGHVVIGVEGDIERTSVRSDEEFLGAGTGTLVSFGAGVTADTQLHIMRTAEQDWNASARLRLGWAWNRVLIYATGGGVWSDLTIYSRDIASTTFNDAVLGFVGHVRDTHASRDNGMVSGWTAGGGIEFAASDFITLALEYRHNAFDERDRDFHAQNNIFPGRSNVDLDTDQVLAKMNVNFSRLWSHREAPATTTTLSDAKDSKASKNVATMLPPEFSWSGFYLGAQGGGNWTDYEYSSFDTDIDVGNLFFEGPGIESSLVAFRTPHFGRSWDDSLTGGGQVGYNFQFGHWVFGVEGDFLGLSSSDAQRYIATNSGFFGVANFNHDATLTNLSTEQKIEQNWNASARGRIGWATGPILWYITGGAAWADLTSRLRLMQNTDFFRAENAIFLSSSNGNSNGQNDETELGWTVGTGVDWALNDFLSVGLEYRHNEFGDINTGIHQQGPFIFSGSSNIDMSSDQVTVRVNLLLGHMH